MINFIKYKNIFELVGADIQPQEDQEYETPFLRAEILENTLTFLLGSNKLSEEKKVILNRFIDMEIGEEEFVKQVPEYLEELEHQSYLYKLELLKDTLNGFISADRKEDETIMENAKKLLALIAQDEKGEDVNDAFETQWNITFIKK